MSTQAPPDTKPSLRRLRWVLRVYVQETGGRNYYRAMQELEEVQRLLDRLYDDEPAGEVSA